MKPMYQVWMEPTVKGVSSGWQSKPVSKPMLNLEDACEECYMAYLEEPAPDFKEFARFVIRELSVEIDETECGSDFVPIKQLEEGVTIYDKWKAGSDDIGLLNAWMWENVDDIFELVKIKVAAEQSRRWKTVNHDNLHKQQR